MKLGYPQKDISQILGTRPAAVTLYAKDKRGQQLSKIIESDTSARLVIDNLMEQIAQRKDVAPNYGEDTFPLILDAAYRIMRVVSSPHPEEAARVQAKSQSAQSSTLAESLLARLQEEQLAAQRNMALAVGTTDEIARTIFRQIASDSIRHAEIVSFVLSMPKTAARRSQRTIQEEIAQIEAIIKDEESATEEPIKNRNLDPALKLLLKSIDLDEEKHKILLRGLLSLNKAKNQ